MTAAADRVGRVQTVRGLVDPGVLGPTMTHEHLLLDIRCLLEPAPASLGPGWSDRPVMPDMRADLIYYPGTNRDDLLLDDEAAATDEVRRFADAGGGAIVDTTPSALARDPLALRRISERRASTCRWVRLVPGAMPAAGSGCAVGGPTGRHHGGEIEVGVGDTGSAPATSARSAARRGRPWS